MIVAKISELEWFSGLKKASKVYELFGPDKDNFKYFFKNLKNGEMPDLSYDNTVLSPKGLLFSQSEKILRYSIDNLTGNEISNIKEIKNRISSRAIIGIRPCDAKANAILATNFNTEEIKDPYWVRAYESTVFIGLACDNPCSTCFCMSVGSGPYATEGLDIILINLEDKNFLAKVITKKGEEFISKAGWQNLLNNSSFIIDEHKINAESKISSKVSIDKLSNIEVMELYEAKFWEEISFSCLNCGICTFVCPTCWCFDIQDESKGNKGYRMKNWDSCMFPIFTVHTTGHNPRGTKLHRVRQRFMHKFKYFIDKYRQGPMCVGCGRCIKSCPVNIDVRSVCGLMNSLEY